MFNDKSGQLMLVSAFMLAITVVTISLMLNNVIYASNLAYVGFMDQSRYDDIGYKQVTAREMNYAYDKYLDKAIPDTTNYGLYMGDYKDAVNSITNIKGRYIEFDKTAMGNPHQMLAQNNPDNHFLSIYGKSSSVSYLIHTGTNTLPTNYAISLQTEGNKLSIFCDNTDYIKLIVTVTDPSNNPVKDQYVRFTPSSSYGRIVDSGGVPQPAQGWKTDLNGQVIAYYYDSAPISYMLTIEANLVGTAKTSSVLISCVKNNAVPTLKIDLSPQTPPNTLSVISDGVDCVKLTPYVYDPNNNNLPVSGVKIKFYTDRGIVYNPLAPGDTSFETGQGGVPTVDLYFINSNSADIGDAQIYAYLDTTTPWTKSNTVTITCEPKVVCTHNPVIDSSKPVTITHLSGGGNNYVIEVPIKFTPQNNGFMAVTSYTATPNTVIAFTNPQPYFTQEPVLKETGTLTITASISGNSPFTIVVKGTFTGHCTIDNVDYSRAGTITITGDKNSVTVSPITYP